MINENINEIKISSTQVGPTARIGVVQALSFFQDNMSEFFRNFNCDGVTLINNYDCFWVLTKTKIKFNLNCYWLDKITLKTNVNKMSSIRLKLSDVIIDEYGESSIDCIQELCLLDSKNRRPMMINKLEPFPKDLQMSLPYSDLEFEKFDFDLEEDSYWGTMTIGVTNTDYFGHTNNVEYVRMLMDTCTFDFVKHINPNMFEIHYIKETKFNDKIRIYKKEMYDTIYFVVRKDSELILKAKLVCD